MDGEMNLLTKNIRHRIVHLAGEYYILDMEKSIWPIFIPFLFWLMPQKMYKIDAEIAGQLRAPASSSSDSSAIVWIGAGGAAILTPLAKPLLDHTIESTVLVNLVLLIGLATFFISLRLYMHKNLRNKLYKTVDIDKLETVKVKIRPKYFKQYTNPIFFWLFSGIFVVVFFYVFLITSDLIPLVVYFLFLPLSLIITSSVVHPHFGKTNLYRVKLIS